MKFLEMIRIKRNSLKQKQSHWNNKIDKNKANDFIVNENEISFYLLLRKKIRDNMIVNFESF
jgi:hypothetical protein